MLRIVKTRKEKEIEKEKEKKELRFIELLHRGVIISSIDALTDNLYDYVIGESDEN